MSDDIVTRLRIACRQEGAEYCGKCQPCEAADEIERLRADRDRWRAACEALWYAGDPESVAHAYELHEQAVRGDS